MSRTHVTLCSVMMLMILVGHHARVSAAGERSEYRTMRHTGSPFVIHYPSGKMRMAQTIEELLTSSAYEIASEIGLGRIDTIDVFLAADERSYREIHGGGVQEWSVAYSDIKNQVLGMRTDAVLQSARPLKVVIRHELSHLLLAQRVGGVRCPTWFVEGLAMVQSDEWTFSDYWRLVNLVWRRELPYLDELEGVFPRLPRDASLAYGLSYLAVKELLRERREDLITLTAFVRDLGSFEAAFFFTFGESPEDFSIRFHILVSRRYGKVGVAMQTAPYWLILTLLFILAYTIRRFRNRRKLREWERMEVDER